MFKRLFSRKKVRYGWPVDGSYQRLGIKRINPSEFQRLDPERVIREWRELKTRGEFSCPECGCPKTIFNPGGVGRLCTRCCEPVFVYQEFIDFNADWKYSKGPWTVTEIDYGKKITIEADSGLIATLNTESIIKARLNASLMALAPEVLHWLNELVIMVQNKTNGKELEDAVVNCFSVISKAQRWKR